MSCCRESRRDCCVAPCRFAWEPRLHGPASVITLKVAREKRSDGETRKNPHAHSGAGMLSLPVLLQRVAQLPMVKD